MASLPFLHKQAELFEPTVSNIITKSTLSDSYKYDHEVPSTIQKHSI